MTLFRFPFSVIRSSLSLTAFYSDLHSIRFYHLFEQYIILSLPFQIYIVSFSQHMIFRFTLHIILSPLSHNKCYLDLPFVPFYHLFEQYIILSLTFQILYRLILATHDMSRDMRFPTMWQFDKCRLRRACATSIKA